MTPFSNGATYYFSKEFEQIGTTETCYVFAGNLRVAMVKDHTTVTYFHKDHLGSSSVVTDANGDALEQTRYMPFGGKRGEGAGISASNYLFTDQELDKESGLYNYDARLYDPIVIGFASPDSLIPVWYQSQNLNRHVYCRNNPLIFVDPTGHEAADIEDYGGLLDSPSEADVAEGLGMVGDAFGGYSGGAAGGVAGGVAGAAEGTLGTGFFGGIIGGSFIGFGISMNLALLDVAYDYSKALEAQKSKEKEQNAETKSKLENTSTDNNKSADSEGSGEQSGGESGESGGESSDGSSVSGHDDSDK